MAAWKRSSSLVVDEREMSSSVIMASTPRAASVENVLESAALLTKYVSWTWLWKPIERRSKGMLVLVWISLINAMAHAVFASLPPERND